MSKIKLSLDDLSVESFETVGLNAQLRGTVHARTGLHRASCDMPTCDDITCGDPTCIDKTCSNCTFERTCDLDPCGESVSCIGEMCEQSDWNDCSRDEECGGSYVC